MTASVHLIKLKPWICTRWPKKPAMLVVSFFPTTVLKLWTSKLVHSSSPRSFGEANSKKRCQANTFCTNNNLFINEQLLPTWQNYHPWLRFEYVWYSPPAFFSPFFDIHGHVKTLNHEDLNTIQTFIFVGWGSMNEVSFFGQDHC